MIPLWPDMREAVALFYDATWLWIPLGMGGTIRSNIVRSELEASARLLGVTMTGDKFADIKVMEDEALKVWSRRRH